MKILNFGSLNIDHVYQVDHLCRPGETLASSSYQVFAGGKGANQSAALARAGAAVYHAGQVGPEGQWLIEKLAALGVDMQFTLIDESPTGHAIIQVDSGGQNSIILYPGANKSITTEHIEATLSYFNEGDILLLQNEINNVSHLIEQAYKRGFTICFNPAPYGPEVQAYALDKVHILVVNETEAMALAKVNSTEWLIDRLAEAYADAEIILTLGEQGVIYRSTQDSLEVPADLVDVVDTTGAGDTFIGYYLAGKAAQLSAVESLQRATRAAGLCVTRPGAMDSIPPNNKI